jgi:hypothetical protein
MLCWTVVSFNYYLIIFHLPKFDGNLYLNGFSITIAELGGNLVIGLIIVYFGLKRTLFICFSAMALSSLILAFSFIDLNILNALLLFGVKFFNTCAFAAVFYGTNALFKDEMVAIIFAICNLFGRLITVFCPLVATCQTSTVIVVYLSLSLFSTICVAFIAEEPVSTATGKSSSRRSYGKKKNNRSRSPTT